MGSGGTYGAGVGGGVNGRRSAAGGAAPAGGVNFIGSMMVCPVDWSWSTSQSLSSSSTGGHTSDGAVLSSVGIDRCRLRSARGSSADAEAPGAAGSAFTGRPAGSASGEGVFRIAARVFTLIPSRSSVKARGRRRVPLALARLIPASTFAIRPSNRRRALPGRLLCPETKKRPAQAYAGSGRSLIGDPEGLSEAGPDRTGHQNQRLSCMTVLLTAVPPSTRQFAVMSCLPPATRSRSESDSSPSAAA